MAANTLVFVELILLFGMKNPDVANCAQLCAHPSTNGMAGLLLFFSVCHLLPTHLFLYSFYIIPRRFNATSDQAVDLIRDVRGLN